MLRRSIFSLVCLVLPLGTVSGSALAGPPWPAKWCRSEMGIFVIFLGLIMDFNTPLTITGPGMWVVQYKNGCRSMELSYKN